MAGSFSKFEIWHCSDCFLAFKSPHNLVPTLVNDQSSRFPLLSLSWGPRPNIFNKTQADNIFDLELKGSVDQKTSLSNRASKLSLLMAMIAGPWKRNI